jgi:hypothetical protein
MTNTLQHYLNPLHVYCRLRDIRVPKGVAILLCKVYERAIFKRLRAGPERADLQTLCGKTRIKKTGGLHRWEAEGL